MYIYDVLKNCCDWPSGSRDIKGAPIGEFIFFCQGGPLNPSNSGSRAGPFRCEKGVICAYTISIFSASLYANRTHQEGVAKNSPAVKLSLDWSLANLLISTHRFSLHHAARYRENIVVTKNLQIYDDFMPTETAPRAVIPMQSGRIGVSVWSEQATYLNQDYREVSLSTNNMDFDDRAGSLR